MNLIAHYKARIEVYKKYSSGSQNGIASPVFLDVLAATCYVCDPFCMRGSRGGQGIRPLKNHKNNGFLSNTGPNPLKINKATKPAFSVGPSLARQRNVI